MQASRRPNAVICYICGRQYGTSSIDIHLKACKKKWELEQEKKPPKERKSCPNGPENIKELV
jgi:hypothetical protein